MISRYLEYYLRQYIDLPLQRGESVLRRLLHLLHYDIAITEQDKDFIAEMINEEYCKLGVPHRHTDLNTQPYATNTIN